MFALLILSYLPTTLTIGETHDLVEVNFYHEEATHKLVFVQVIWWDYSAKDAAYRVADWRMLKHEDIHPYRDGVLWRSLWFDDGQLRSVYAKACRVTRTLFDPEYEDREHRCRSMRTKLRKVKNANDY